MMYRIIYAESFLAGLDQQLAYLIEQRVSLERIESWFARLFETISGLESLPRRHAVSPVESEALGVEIRKLAFGDYLLFYTVDEDAKTVSMLRFRHGARLPDSDAGLA